MSKSVRKEFDGTKYRGFIDILTGGFPCQPFSVAGKQKGKGDDRYLWPEMLRVIREVWAPWVVGENVPGIIGMELENICLALEGEGYEIQPFIIPSASIGAWDKRERVWIIAYNRLFRQEINEEQAMGCKQLSEVNTNPDKLDSNDAGYNSGAVSKQQEAEVQFNCNSDFTGVERHSWNELTKREKEQIRRNGQANWSRTWIEVASELCRSNARISIELDETIKYHGHDMTNRIKALGNSVNPHVVFQIFKAIENYKIG